MEHLVAPTTQASAGGESLRERREPGVNLRQRRLWWCLPAAVLCAADGVLTLWGQPDAYWSGDFASIREGHPVAAWFLSAHPLAFAAAGVPYLLLVAALVLWLPRWWAALTAVGVASGHALAVIAWCRILFNEPAYALMAFGLVVVALAMIVWQRGAGHSESRRSDA